MQQISKQPAFELGQIVATPGAFGHAQEGRTTAGRVPHAPCQPRVIVMWNSFWQEILRARTWQESYAQTEHPRY